MQNAKRQWMKIQKGNEWKCKKAMNENAKCKKAMNESAKCKKAMNENAKRQWMCTQSLDISAILNSIIFSHGVNSE